MMKLWLIIVLMVNAFNAHASAIVKLGTKLEWLPYHLDAPDGADGTAVRMVACIMARINQPFEIQKKPWKRVQHETQQGKLDGFFAASKNDNRDSFATLTDTFIPQQRVFYSKKSTIKIPLKQYTLDYIKQNVKVAARFGSNALQSLIIDKYNVVVTPQTQQQLIDVLDSESRVGAILENSVVFESLLKQQGKVIDDYYPIVHKRNDMGVYFSHQFLKKNVGFLERFNRNIQPCLDTSP